MFKVAMDINKQKIKNIILVVIDFIKKFLFLSNLSKVELQGFIKPLTRFRLMPYTKIEAPYILGRTVRGVSFDGNITLDPAGRLCMDVFSDEDCKTAVSNLSPVFEKQKDMSAADIVNLSNNITLKKYPVWALVMPWEKLNIEEMFESYPRIFYKNRSDQGLIFEDKSRSSIIKTMYSPKFIENRVNQMNKLYESIMRQGFLQDSNLPKINILVKENEWRWFMGDGGNHRSYVLCFLGHEFFNARVSSIINKNEVNKWHNVRNGTYSVSDAESIFDSYFDGSKVHRGMV
tara:strand:- start:201 stop:1067 length:867 start_codon:yes stop_codon:yes gene_type:complete